MRNLLKVLNPFYRLAVEFRSCLYAIGMLKARTSPLPVICIGNLTVGGTGKTPMVEYVVSRLLELGFRPGIITRGYKRVDATQNFVIVSDGLSRQPRASVAQSGDEPMLLAMRLPGVPVIVCADRFSSCEYLYQNKLADVVVMDDGLQHLQLQRDANLVLVDANVSLENECLLPAGNLRETCSGIKRGTAILHTKVPVDESYSFAAQNERLLRKFAPGIPAFLCRYQTDSCYDETGATFDLAKKLRDRRVVVVAGLANPRLFFEKVAMCALDCTLMRLGDHAVYDFALIEDLKKQLEREKLDYVVTTEKDWVKLKTLIDESLRDRFIVATQTVDVHHSDEFDRLLVDIIEKSCENRRI